MQPGILTNEKIKYKGAMLGVSPLLFIYLPRRLTGWKLFIMYLIDNVMRQLV